MKTPEEIKKELERCTTYMCGFPCEGCSYGIDAEKVESDCVDALLKDALAYIKQLEAAHPKWISVKEQKPKKGQYVLTCDSIGIQQVLCYNAIKDGFTTLRNHRPFYVHNITHWMPLPEPPKDDCNEQ